MTTEGTTSPIEKDEATDNTVKPPVADGRIEKTLAAKASEIKDKAAKGALMEAEEQEQGVVNWRVYRGYLTAGGNMFYYLALPIFFCLSQAFQTGGDFWLARWSTNLSDTSFPTGGYLGVYGAFVGATTIVTFMRSLSVAFFGLRTSRGLHHNLGHAILSKCVSWFDRTPGGRIINRFSKDIYSVDYMIPVMFEYALSIALQVVGTLIVVAIIIPIMLVVFVPLMVVYLWLTHYFRMSNRDLARIESISRTPLAAHFAETLNGSVTIRALKVQPMYMMENVSHTDDNTRALYFNQTVMMWMRVRLDALGSVILGACAVFAVASIGGQTVSPGSFGLLISYGLGITNNLNYAVFLASFAESMMNSVERILFYSRAGQDAEKWEPNNKALNQDIESGHCQWPNKGQIVFEDVTLRYRSDLDLVLKGLNMTFEGGHRIGIVGRTGSGKSSILVALFRIVELGGGSITIDGINIQDISLTTLRSRISIIPQDASLFYGTLRYNLDPFYEYSDTDIWNALSYVQLKAVIERMPLQLLSQVNEAGSNLSAGQRQLLCLARALLRQSRIVCLDEATANVDIETDQLIQRVVREQFHDRTILTIAHRLNTILDYDRVIVLDHGKVVEEGSPNELRQKENGIFNAMLQRTTAAATACTNGM